MPTQNLEFHRAHAVHEGGSRAEPAGATVAGRDRRSAPRYPARGGGEAISLSWRHGDEIEGECAGRIVDLGFGGALLEVESLPPACAALWLRAQDESESDWIEVTGVEARRHGSGPHLLRVAFAESCPYRLFRWVVWGPHRESNWEAAPQATREEDAELPWGAV